MSVYLGLDIGSISVNTALMSSEGTVLQERYDYCHGRPFHVLEEILGQVVPEAGEIAGVALTGSGG